MITADWSSKSKKNEKKVQSHLLNNYLLRSFSFFVTFHRRGQASIVLFMAFDVFGSWSTPCLFWMRQQSSVKMLKNRFPTAKLPRRWASASEAVMGGRHSSQDSLIIKMDRALRLISPVDWKNLQNFALEKWIERFDQWDRHRCCSPIRNGIHKSPNQKRICQAFHTKNPFLCSAPWKATKANHSVHLMAPSHQNNSHFSFISS